jgi:heme-degrading monooxygenase HmoA
MPAPASGPVRATLTMTLPAGAAQEFEEEWARVARWVAGKAGCLRQTLARAGDTAECVYVITSDWSDLAAYRQFEHSQRQDDMTARLRALRTSARMEIHAIVRHHEPLATAGPRGGARDQGGETGD